MKYLGFFLEDDAELEHIKTVIEPSVRSIHSSAHTSFLFSDNFFFSNQMKEYGAGRMLTGEVKQRLVQVLTEVVERHRKARAAVTDEVFNIYNIIRAFHMFFKKGRYFFFWYR